MLSEEYPRTEAGRNPFGRFSKSLAGYEDDVLDQFYIECMARLCGVEAGCHETPA